MRNGDYLRNLGCIGTNGKFPTSGILERNIGKDISSLGMGEIFVETFTMNCDPLRILTNE